MRKDKIEKVNPTTYYEMDLIEFINVLNRIGDSLDNMQIKWTKKKRI